MDIQCNQVGDEFSKGQTILKLFVFWYLLGNRVTESTATYTPYIFFHFIKINILMSKHLTI